MERSAIQWALEPLRNYADFKGRARRSELWWFVLACFGISLVLGVIDLVIFNATTIGPLGGLFSLVLLVPNLAVEVRRLHDLDKSGWWLLIGLIPLIGAFILLFWFAQRGTVGPNRFGPDPLAGDLGTVFS